MTSESGIDVMAAEIPGYVILNSTGKGAMGHVFVARQVALDRRVAIKFLAFDYDSHREERLARFRREAAIMASLSHPNIVAIHDFGEVDGRPYLVMEFVEGGDLRRRMPESGPMPLAAILSALTPIAQALAYLHSKGILHRDLKPENILMQGDVPKVADFGIAIERSGSGELTRSNQGLGTLGYIAPEQQYRLAVDERADQYSLAAMAYEMLTGLRPLGVFKAPSHHNAESTPEIDRVVLRALDDDPDRRFDSVLSFLAALREAIESKAQPEPHKSRLVALVPAALLIPSVIGCIWWAAQGVGPGQSQTKPTSASGERLPFDTPAWPKLEGEQLDVLTHRRANELWLSQGSPGGEEGDAISKRNWYRAQGEVRAKVRGIANGMWKSRIRIGPPFDPAEVNQVWDDAMKRALSDGEEVPSKPEGR